MSDDLERKLKGWADQAAPVSAHEARARADAGHLGALGPDGDDHRSSGSRRMLAAAAAVILVGAVAIGGWLVANNDDDSPTGVDTAGEPTVSTSVDPTTTRDSTIAPDATTAEAPNLIVVHSAEHRLEVFDRPTGETVRVLAEFAAPGSDVSDRDAESMARRYLSSFVVSPDGQAVYFASCCGPTPITPSDRFHEVFRTPIAGGQPELVTHGTNPALSPDGTKLAVMASEGMREVDDNVEVGRPALKVVDLAEGGEQIYPLVDDVTHLTNPTWSPDSSMLVMERYDDSLEDGRVVLATLDGTEDELQAASTVARTNVDGIPMHPVFDADGNILVIRQTPGPGFDQTPDPTKPAWAETYDPLGDGEPISSVELDGPVVSQRTAGGGRFVLRTFADGTLRSDLGDGDMLEILGHGYLAAAW